MGHGTTEYEAAPADPKEDSLFAEYKRWEALATHANANLRDAEVNVQLAKVAYDTSHDRAQAAAIALRKYRDTKRR